MSWSVCLYTSLYFYSFSRTIRVCMLMGRTATDMGFHLFSFCHGVELGYTVYILIHTEKTQQQTCRAITIAIWPTTRRCSEHAAVLEQTFLTPKRNCHRTDPASHMTRWSRPALPRALLLNPTANWCLARLALSCAPCATLCICSESHRMFSHQSKYIVQVWTTSIQFVFFLPTSQQKKIEKASTELRNSTVETRLVQVLLFASLHRSPFFQKCPPLQWIKWTWVASGQLRLSAVELELVLPQNPGTSFHPILRTNLNRQSSTHQTKLLTSS